MKKKIISIVCAYLVMIMLVSSLTSCFSFNGDRDQEDETKNYNVNSEKESGTERETIDESASKKVSSMTHSVVEWSDEVEINIYLKNLFGYSVQAAVYVDVKIVNKDGMEVYKKTLTKLESQDEITINYDDVVPGTTNIGTLYYKVYTDYVSFDEVSKELGKLPWTIDVQLPKMPKKISYVSVWGESETIYSSCKVTEISYKVSGDDLNIFFTGEKTYDKDGNSNSNSCKIAWKLYDDEGFVVEDGVCYTTTVTVGEKFKTVKDTAYNVIEQGKSYRLEILDYLI